MGSHEELYRKDRHRRAFVRRQREDNDTRWPIDVFHHDGQTPYIHPQSQTNLNSTIIPTEISGHTFPIQDILADKDIFGAIKKGNSRRNRLPKQRGRAKEQRI